MERLIGEPAELLLVEDNPVDVMLTQAAFKHWRISNNLNVVMDGVEAIQYLRREGKYANAVRPDIVLLDLNLPKMDGREVLAEIKQDPDLKRIPVVMLTTSESEEDVVKTYNLHVNCYIAKPVDMQKFAKILRSIEDFWFTIVKLPPK